MIINLPDIEKIKEELVFTTSRSGGPGGQNVNKVNSKVLLKWNVANSSVLDEGQKKIILHKLKNKLTRDGILLLQAQESRSQHVNREEVVNKLTLLVKGAFTVRKKRKPTKPTKTAIQKRVKEKKLKGEKKQWRQKPEH